MPKQRSVKIHLVLPDGVVSSEFLSDVETQIQKYVQGYFAEITVVYLGRRRTAYINEDAIARAMSFNKDATKYVQAAHDVATVPIYGPMVVRMSR